MATGDLIPDDHHVLRHVKGTKIQNGIVDGSAFVKRPDEDGLSVEWLELAGYEPADQLPAIRRVYRRERTKTHRFVELNVAKTRAFVGREASALHSMIVQLRFEHEPQPATAAHLEEPYHSEIFGTPPHDALEAKAIGDLIAECAGAQYEALSAT